MLRKIFFCAAIFFLAASFAFSESKFPFVGEVSSEGVNVRAGQHISFERLARLKKGTEVIVVAKNYDWYKINLPDIADCFVSKKYVRALSDGTGEITANRVNVRASAKEKSSIIGQLGKGTRVKIKGHSPGWVMIEPADGIYGWVSAKLVSYKSDRVPLPKVIEEPIRIAYKKPEQKPAEENEEKKREESPAQFSIVGRIEDVGRVVPVKTIRYKLIVDPKTIYYLEGDKALLDGSVNFTVRVDGILKPESEKRFKYPVILVIKINSLVND